MRRLGESVSQKGHVRMQQSGKQNCTFQMRDEVVILNLLETYLPSTALSVYHLSQYAWFLLYSNDRIIRTRLHYDLVMRTKLNYN